MPAPGFGDRAYRSADLIPPVAHYPKHPTSTPFEDALKNTYLHAQYHSRLISFQPYGYDLQNPFGDATAVDRAFSSTTWVSIARARRNLPEEINKIKAYAAVAVLSLGASAFHMRITLDNGVASPDTTSNNRLIDARSSQTTISSLSFNEQARLRAEFPFTDGHAPFIHEISIGLTNIDPAAPGRVRVTLDAYAISNQDSSAVRVQPLFAMITGEMVY